MDNRISLAEYLSSYRSIYEKRKVFYAISKKMHQVHNNGEYISNLSFQSISVCFTNPTDIRFANYKKIGQVSIEEVMKIKFENVKKLAHLAVCSYLDNFDYRGAVLNIEVLKKEFNQLKHCYHLDDLKYFEKVLFGAEYLYYDDYIEDLEGTTKESFGNDEGAFTNYFLLFVNIGIMFVLCFSLFIFMH